MSRYAEVKANTIYFAAKTIGESFLERKLPPLDFTALPAPHDSFQLAAQTAYRQLRESTGPAEKAKSAIEVCQQLINTSRFSQARQLLRKLPILTDGLSPEQTIHLIASRQEKYGWIADAETGYSEAQIRFRRVKMILNQVSPEKWSDDFKNIDSTATHFGARAKLGLAFQGINPEHNLQSSRADFMEDLAHFQLIRQQGDPRPFNEGFQYGWLATASLKRKDLPMADREIHKAEELFQEGLQAHPESGIMAHAHLLRGLWHLEHNKPGLARNHFTEAAKLRTEVEKYPLGLAFAQLGIAETYFKERSVRDGIQHLKQAVQTQPAILLYVVNGRILG